MRTGRYITEQASNTSWDQAKKEQVWRMGKLAICVISYPEWIDLLTGVELSTETAICSQQIG